MYIEDEYLDDEIDFKSDIKITNVNDDWKIEEKPDDIETIEIDQSLVKDDDVVESIQLDKPLLKRKLEQEKYGRKRKFKKKM